MHRHLKDDTDLTTLIFLVKMGQRFRVKLSDGPRLVLLFSKLNSSWCDLIFISISCSM